MTESMSRVPRQLALYGAAVEVATLRAKHAALAAVFTERSRRIWAATEARAIGHGGIAPVERATEISRSTIQRDLRELSCARFASGPAVSSQPSPFVDRRSGTRLASERHAELERIVRAQ